MGNKKLADFHFKLIHKILPCQENLYRWKMTESNKCRFGCQDIENYNHLFIACPKLNHLIAFTEKVMQHLGFTVKLSIKTLIFGYKLTYNAYHDVNKLLSYIFYTIYKYWLKNDMSINAKKWVFNELKQWKSLYYHTKEKFLFLSQFIDKWIELSHIVY